MKPPRLKWPAAYDLSCSTDDRLLACLGRNVVVIDLVDRRRVFTSHPLSHPSSVGFSPDGERLVVKGTSGRIVVLDCRSGELLHDYKNQKEGEGSRACFTADGEGIVDGSWNGVLTHRGVGNGAVLERESFPGEMITRVTHTRDRSVWLVEHSPIVRPGENMPAPGYLSVRRWPFSPEGTRKIEFDKHIQSATLSPDGSRFCFLQKWDDRQVHIARVSDGQIVASSSPLGGRRTGGELAWSHDGHHVAAALGENFLIFRATDLTLVETVPTDYPSSVAFLPGDKEVALGSWSRTTVLGFDGATGRLRPA